MKSGLWDLWPLRLLKVVAIKIIKSFSFLPDSYYYYGSFIY